MGVIGSIHEVIFERYTRSYAGYARATWHLLDHLDPMQYIHDQHDLYTTNTTSTQSSRPYAVYTRPTRPLLDHLDPMQYTYDQHEHYSMFSRSTWLHWCRLPTDSTTNRPQPDRIQGNTIIHKTVCINALCRTVILHIYIAMSWFPFLFLYCLFVASVSSAAICWNNKGKLLSKHGTIVSLGKADWTSVVSEKAELWSSVWCCRRDQCRCFNK